MRASEHMRERAKGLRRALTVSEQRLWKWLRNRSFSGYKFRRQVPIDRYVVDFYCAELKLVMEADGDQHDFEVSDYDTERTVRLRRHGIELVRIASEVLARDSFTAEIILRAAIEKRARH